MFPPRVIVVGEGDNSSEMGHYCLGWVRERIMDVRMGVTGKRYYNKERRNAR